MLEDWAMLLIPRLLTADGVSPPLGQRRAQKLRALRVRSVLVVLLRLGGANVADEGRLDTWDCDFSARGCGSLSDLCDTQDRTWHALGLPEQLGSLLQKVVAGVRASARVRVQAPAGPAAGAAMLGKRERSVGQRLRLVSDLAKSGGISTASKGVLKDAIITGDRNVERALALYENTGDPNFLQHLVSSGGGGGGGGGGARARVSTGTTLQKRRVVRVARGGGRGAAPAASQQEYEMTATTSTLGRDTAAEASTWASLDIALDLNDVHLGGAILDGAITMGGGGRSTVSGRATSVEQARELFISTNTAAPPPPVPNSQSAASPSAVRGGRSSGSGRRRGGAALDEQRWSNIPSLGAAVRSATEASLWGALDAPVDQQQQQQQQRTQGNGQGASAVSSGGRTTSIEQARQLFVSTNGTQREPSLEEARRLFLATKAARARSANPHSNATGRAAAAAAAARSGVVGGHGRCRASTMGRLAARTNNQPPLQRASAARAPPRREAPAAPAAAPNANLEMLMQIQLQAQQDAHAAMSAAAAATATMQSRGGARFSSTAVAAPPAAGM